MDPALSIDTYELYGLSHRILSSVRQFNGKDRIIDSLCHKTYNVVNMQIVIEP